MTGHTPGPWFFEKHVDAGWDVFSRDSMVVGDTGVVNEIDARLIAAAPDLLAACEAYLDAMERYGHPDKTDRLMAAAIKKAKGDVSNRTDTGDIE